MKNVYNGVVTTDADGYATVELPDWFEALNRDFRYQLTVIDGGEAFVLAKVAREIEENRFVDPHRAAGNVKVSWQVTGIRQDAYAERHRIPVEEWKPESRARALPEPGRVRCGSGARGRARPEPRGASVGQRAAVAGAVPAAGGRAEPGLISLYPPNRGRFGAAAGLGPGTSGGAWLVPSTIA